MSRLDARADVWRKPGESDAELVTRAVRDTAQFSVLYERYADRIYRYALARTRSVDLADDVVSETMLAALQGLERFDPEQGEFAGWLFTIAARKIADQQRYHRRFWRMITRRWKPEHAPELDPLTERLIQSEAYQEVRAGLDKLSTAEREILLLRYSADLNSTEIGNQLGITSANARVRLQRARRKLARELGDTIDA